METLLVSTKLTQGVTPFGGNPLSSWRMVAWTAILRCLGSRQILSGGHPEPPSVTIAIAMPDHPDAMALSPEASGRIAIT